MKRYESSSSEGGEKFYWIHEDLGTASSTRKLEQLKSKRRSWLRSSKQSIIHSRCVGDRVTGERLERVMHRAKIEGQSDMKTKGQHHPLDEEQTGERLEGFTRQSQETVELKRLREDW